MNWLRSGLSRRFAAVIGTLSLLPVLFFYGRVLRSSEGVLEKAVLAAHVRLAEQGAERVSAWIESVDGRVQVALLALESLEGPARRGLLQRLVGGAGMASFALLDRDGNVTLEASDPKLARRAALDKGASDAARRKALSARGRSIELIRAAAGPLLVLHYPFGRGGLARAVLPLSQAERIFSAAGEAGFAVLIGSDGRPLLAPEGRDLAGLEDWPITRQALRPDRPVGSAEFTASSGVRYVGSYAPVPPLGGAVLMLQPRAEAYLAVDETQRAAGFAILVVIAASLAGAALAGRALSSPVLELTRAAEAVSRGNFEARVDIKTISGLVTGEELKDLAETFNAMAERLRQYSLLQVDRMITEQRRTEAVLFSIGEGIVMTDPDGRVQLANRLAREMFGIPADTDLEGRALPQALPEGPLRAALLAAGEKAGEFKEVNLSTETQRRFLRAVASPVVSPGRGGVLGTVYALRDVTLERELDRMKEDFLQYITHDLRNPLTSAMGFLDHLAKGTAGVLNPEQTMIVSSVRRSASRLMGMINNILDIAKMEAGRMRLNLKTVSLAGIASRSIEMLEQFASGRNVSVRLVAVEEFSVEADEDMIERVFMNLLANAIKYTPSDGAVTISISDAGPVIQCCVEDTGEGIPVEAQGRVFEKFEQVIGNKRGGTGLGLTISRFFVESHLGKIWVESQVGRGSRFYFTVPKGLVADADGRVRIVEPAPEGA